MKYLIILLFCLPLFTLAQDLSTATYKIYSSTKQKIVTIDEVVADMATANVLFFGEEHNDSIGHSLEYVLFKKLADAYPNKVALSMEMFETDCQNVLNEYLGDQIREKNFITEARAWHNYKDYRMLIELAKASKIDVIAANAPARYTNRVNRLGLQSLNELNKISKSYLPPLPIDTATGNYYDKFVNIMGGHEAMGNMQLYQAQNLWDATMAWSIATYYKKHRDLKILQINGSFHSEEKLGVPAQLKKYAPNIKILNIATCTDDNFDSPDWKKLSQNGDYILLTDPKLPRSF
jgi:uncharacterized iron-regulated protein